MNNKQQSAETKPQKSTEAQVTNDSHGNGNTHVGCSPLVVTNLKINKQRFISSFLVNIVNKETDEFLIEQPVILSKEEYEKMTEILHKNLSDHDFLWLKEVVLKLDSVGAKIKTFGTYFIVNTKQP